MKKKLIKNLFFKMVMMAIFAVVFVVPTQKVNATITDGSTVNYTGYVQQEGNYLSVKFQVEDYVGSCIDSDKSYSSGQAVMHKVDNNTKWAKAAYYFGVKKNWQKGLGGHGENADATNAGRLQEIMQYFKGNRSRSDVADILDNSNYSDWQNNVPDGFEIFWGSPTSGSDQPFVVWRYVPPFIAKKSYASGSVGANNAPLKVGDEITYQIKWENGNGSVVVEDTLSNGLQYVNGSSNKGNPTISGQKLTWSGLTGETGTLTYKAKVVDAAISTAKVCNNAVATSGTEKKTLAQICNPVPSKVYGGSSLSDNKGWNHHEVLMPDKAKSRAGDTIKYKVTLPNVKSSAQTVVVTDVLSKGLTYNSATITGGTITNTAGPTVNKDTKQTTIVWTVSVPANSTAVLNYSATVNDDAVNIVNNNANATYSGYSSTKLNELHNPVPRKKYDVDTANGMNGKIVQKDDVITYNISYANGFIEKATINLRDTLSKGLSYKKGTAKVCDMNKENCKSLQEAGMKESVVVKTNGETVILWTRTGMPSLGVEIIVYDVTVTGETIKVQNNFDIKSCKDTTATQQTETISGCETQIDPQCEPRCTAGSEGCKAATSEECTQTKQECSVTGLVCNNPWTDIEELKNPVPEKKYNDKTPSGFNHTAVAERDRIRYEIRYANVAEEKVTITIKDTISKGIEYVKGTSKINGKKIEDPKLSNNNKTLTWTRELEKGAEESLTYEVIVTGETTKVKNKACMTYSNNPDYERCLKELENPVPQKRYSDKTKAGKNGAVVKKNDIITYSIKYSNVKDTTSNVVIMDNLSKGLEYVKGSSKVNGKKIEPLSVTKDPNGTMLVWVKEIAAGKYEELTYDVKVTGEKLLVENNATIQYDDDPTIKLDELRNPLYNNENVPVPDTGSNIAIISVISGIILVAGGGYIIYRKLI